MKIKNDELVLYLVTDRQWLSEGEKLEDAVESAIKGGATFIQLREKHLSVDEFKKLALDIKKVTDKYNIPFVINDNIEVAVEIDADGVHIGQTDMDVKSARKLIGKNKILGVSAGNMDEAIKAEEDGADYLGVGAVFPTNTKSDAECINISLLSSISKAVGIPIVGIGGIDETNIGDLKNTGINGVAVISAILSKDDIESASKNLYNKSIETFY